MKILALLCNLFRTKLPVWLAGFLLVLLSPQSQAATVIANPSVGTQAVSLSEVRAIFSMRLRRWPNGSTITVFTMTSKSAEHAAFCKAVLNIYPHQLQASWDRMVYSGLGKAPISVNSEDEMRAMVAATPGAIGYVAELKPNEKGVVELPLKQ